MKKSDLRTSTGKRFGIGSFVAPLLIFSIIFPLQIFNETRPIYYYDEVAVASEYNVKVSLGEKILNFFNLPAWSQENSQGKNFVFIYAYFLFYLSLFLGSFFPNHWLSLKINKKILFISFFITTALLILLYSANSPTVLEPSIVERGIDN